MHFGFVMEQTLGHVTHHQNLARWVAEDADVRSEWMPIPFATNDLWEKLPVIRGNWSLKSSLRARDALRAVTSQRRLNALFIHTQTLSLFAVPFMRKTPTVISLDATPMNYDKVGSEYGHNTGNISRLERRKYLWNQQKFREAAALVTWCQWAKDSLVADYGISADKVTVIPPGVDMAKWSFGREKVERARHGDSNRGMLRLLFVGADFERKGGRDLVEAYRGDLQRTCELDIVTRDEGLKQEYAGIAGLRVHCGLTANSEPLKRLFSDADMFVFPTRGDCLPIAVMEAMAAGLPIIATDVGALREEVEDGVNGLVVPPRDAGAVREAVQALASDAGRRGCMAERSRQMAEARFDARANYGAILALMKTLAR